MCGRFVSERPVVETARIFAASNAASLPNLAPNWNVAPTQSAAVVRRHPETGDIYLDALRWGLVPRWAKDAKGGAKLINARSETVAEKPSFRDAYRKRRCLVPVDAFYEWKREGEEKAPFAISRRDGGPLAFAGLWEGWKGEGGEVLRTFCVVTTEANAPMAAIHDRMPVILEEADWPRWLEAPDADLLRPAADDVLRLTPVRPLVNSVRNNGPELLEPVPETPAEGGGPNPA